MTIIGLMSVFFAVAAPFVTFLATFWLGKSAGWCTTNDVFVTLGNVSVSCIDDGEHFEAWSLWFKVSPVILVIAIGAVRVRAIMVSVALVVGISRRTNG
ncbi:hypothetical protein ACLB2K_006865 [Fragaria x ananassa]